MKNPTFAAASEGSTWPIRVLFGAGCRGYREAAPPSHEPTTALQNGWSAFVASGPTGAANANSAVQRRREPYRPMLRQHHGPAAAVAQGLFAVLHGLEGVDGHDPPGRRSR
jgi:hypothetical protein